jgi:hypothetical protein
MVDAVIAAVPIKPAIKPLPIAPATSPILMATLFISAPSPSNLFFSPLSMFYDVPLFKEYFPHNGAPFWFKETPSYFHKVQYAYH